MVSDWMLVFVLKPVPRLRWDGWFLRDPRCRCWVEEKSWCAKIDKEKKGEEAGS